MPTKHPRVNVTMKAETLALLDSLCVAVGRTRPEVLRLALRALAKAKGVSAP